jgi:hypothetical protein
MKLAAAPGTVPDRTPDKGIVYYGWVGVKQEEIRRYGEMKR